MVTAKPAGKKVFVKCMYRIAIVDILPGIPKQFHQV
jgi:hypothetical protein